MPELSSIEALQPSLLDRLTDTSRFIERLSLAWRDTALEQARVSREEVREMLETLGLRIEGRDVDGSTEIWENRPGGRRFRSMLELRPRPETPPLSEFVEVRERTLIPNTRESREERVITGRGLRQLVLRDLAWLLNTGQIGAVINLTPYPNVQQSVLNYGIPELAGLTISSVDLPRIAEGIRLAIERFEPRLRSVTVTPAQHATEQSNSVSFVIEGMLWAQPLPERLYLHTELDLENAAMTVRDPRGRDV